MALELLLLLLPSVCGCGISSLLNLDLIACAPSGVGLGWGPFSTVPCAHVWRSKRYETIFPLLDGDDDDDDDDWSKYRTFQPKTFQPKTFPCRAIPWLTAKRPVDRYE
uniref:Putative secreted protein n=1 Tax=Anopheles marajoara TaxID=58244 RepID=A0A2M4C948_9DIPT